MSECLHFSIEGEFITNHFRGLLLEGNWEMAINGLQKSLISSDSDGNTIYYPYECAIKLLMGKEQLVGIDSDMELISDSKEKEILEHMDFLYGNLLFIRNKWYEPYAYVNTCIESQPYVVERALIYSNNPNEDIVLFGLINGQQNAILCERTDKVPPLWMLDLYKKNSIKDILNKGIKFLKERGLESNQDLYDVLKYQRIPYDLDYVSVEEDFREELESSILFNSLRTKILEQAKKGTGFFETTLQDGRKFIIPKAPFFNWCIKDYLNNNLNKMPWNIISPRGLKMQGDDPQHSDWVIGMGIYPEKFYNDKLLNEHMYDLSFKILKLFKKDDFIKISGTGYFSGIPIFINENFNINNIKEQSIIILPNSSIEYLEIAKEATKKKCCLLSLVGGPAAHLCVNANELKLNFAVKPDLKIDSNSYLFIDLDKGVLNVT